MSIKIIQTKNGKPCISIDRYRYRLDRTLVGGDVSWRCLGRDCSASVRTNADYTEVVSRKNNHVGKHPVTLQSLSGSPASTPPSTTRASLSNSPLLYQRAALPLTSEAACQTEQLFSKSKEDLINRVNELIFQRDGLISKVQEQTLLLENLPFKVVESSCSCSTELEGLVFENRELKQKLDNVDLKLLDLSNENKSNQVIVSLLRENIDSLRLELEDVNRYKSKLLKTIDDLNSDLDQYRVGKKISDNILPAPPLPTSNRFQILTNENEDSTTQAYDVAKKPSIGLVRSKRTSSSKQRSKRNFNISVSLNTDSHGRGMNTMLRSMFSSKNTTVCCGTIKPGAPVAEVVRNIKYNSSISDRHEYIVCIAGTNDISCKDFNIVKVVQEYIRLAAGAPSTRFLIATVPTRFDLSPYCHENVTIRALNSKLWDLPKVRKNIKILNLSSKRRHLFRGIHFHAGGKRVICKEIYNTIETWSRQHSSAQRRTADSVSTGNNRLYSAGPSGMQPPVTPSKPRCSTPDLRYQHISYADAVRRPSSPGLQVSTQTPDKCALLRTASDDCDSFLAGVNTVSRVT